MRLHAQSRETGGPPQRKSRGCFVILKTDERIEMAGITVTTVKHFRRVGRSIPMVGQDGKKRLIEARLIREIYQLY